MKKHFKPLTLLMSFLLILTLLSGCGNGGEAALVLTNGVIYTVDGDNWQNEPAEAVTVDANGIILFVGSAAEAYMHQWGYTSVMCLVPHFIDASIYKAFYDSGELALRINLAGGRSGSGWDPCYLTSIYDAADAFDMPHRMQCGYRVTGNNALLL